MKKPVLALVPSAYKTSKVYSVLPVNGDGDFDLSRGSNATRVRKDGLIETVNSDVPRLDWLNSNCPSLLLEPTRTNYAINSSDASLWGNVSGSQSITKTQNFSVSPTGENNATRLKAKATGSDYSLIQLSTTSITGNYTGSVYLKSNTQNTQNIIVYGRNTAVNSYEIGNEWKRIDLQGSGTTGQNLFLFIGSFPSNGSDEIIDISVWGGQLEQGNCPTSYIETLGTPVTRNEDVCGDAGNADLFSSNEGTMFVDIQKTFKDGSFGRISISDGSNTDRVVIGKQSNNTQFRMFINRVNSGNVIAQYYPFLDFDVQNKLAITFKFGEFKFYVNGVLASTQTPNEDIPIGLSKFAFNENNLGNTDFYGEINDVRYYDRVLTEAEAIKLTT